MRYLPSVGYVKDTGTPKGRGVFAGRALARGEICEICPLIHVHTPFDRLPPEIRRILFGGTVIGLPPGNTGLVLGYGSVYNHANPANLRYTATDDRQGMIYIADRDIEKDEELTINYNASGGATRSTKDNWFMDNGVTLYREPEDRGPARAPSPESSQPLANTVCPLCGGANQCAPASAGTFEVPCWCTRAPISREALAKIPPERVGKACLCPRCAGVLDASADPHPRAP